MLEKDKMANCWIFTVKDDKIEQERIKGIEIYKRRMSDSFWGFSGKSRNRSSLKKGDHVVFYLAGSGGQKFVGTCTLASDWYKLGVEDKSRLDHGTFFRADYGVNLANVKVWPSAADIRPLVSTLAFITNKDYWRSHLQGSIREISEKDCKRIISANALKEITDLSNKSEPSLTDLPSYDEVARKVRNHIFRREIRRLYNCSCAVCGKSRFTNSKYPEVESAHIYPKEKNGSDDLRNGIALCRLHHWAFEWGLFSMNDDYSIIVEDRILNEDQYEEISRFENARIKLPNERNFWPHAIFLREHRRIHGFG
jgi:predicted RNA-binding protein